MGLPPGALFSKKGGCLVGKGPTGVRRYFALNSKKLAHDGRKEVAYQMRRLTRHILGEEDLNGPVKKRRRTYKTVRVIASASDDGDGDGDGDGESAKGSSDESAATPGAAAARAGKPLA